MLAVVIGGFLSACSVAPTTEELELAEGARGEGLRILAGVDIPALSGWTPVAERNMDACGSETSDRDFNEFHIEGYSCAAVRRSVYRLDDSTAAGGEDAAAFRAVTELQQAFAAAAEAQDTSGVNVSQSPPTADGFVEIDGKHVRLAAHMMPIESVDIDMLPLWHRNETVVQDDGALSEKLRRARIGGAELLTVTTTVTYFDQTRTDE